MKSYSSYAKQFQKCNAQNVFFMGINVSSFALVDISWLKANPVKILVNGNWMLSPSRTTSSRRRDPTVLGTGKTETQKEHFVAHNARKRCIKKNFDGIHDRFQRDPVYVIRNSKLAGPRRSASRWITWHRKTTPTAHPLRNTRDIGKTGISQ